MLTFGPFHYRDCLEICRNLRQADREEIAATREDDGDPEKVAQDCEKWASFSWIAYKDKVPVVVIGAAPLGPKVMSAYMLATPQIRAVGLGLTRWALRVFVPFLLDLGVHRFECHSLDSHADAHKWLLAVGAHLESKVPKFGKNGETFFRFVRLWDNP